MWLIFLKGVETTNQFILQGLLKQIQQSQEPSGQEWGADL